MNCIDKPHSLTLTGNLIHFAIILLSEREVNRMQVMTIRVKKELYQKIKSEAEDRGITINSLVVSVLWRYLRK